MSISAQTMDETQAQSQDQGGQSDSDLKSFFQDLQDLLVKVTPLGDAQAAQLRAKIEQSMDAVKTSALRGAQRVTEASKAAARSTDDYVHANPWTTAGISALVGLALGVTLARRS